MAGYGYTHVIRRYAITADVLGGYAIGSIKISDPALAAYQRALGVTSAEANATNTLVLKPEIGVWYDITKKVFLNVNAGYMFARPDVDDRHVRGDRHAQGARRSVHPQGRRRLLHLLMRPAILPEFLTSRRG